LFGLWHHYLGPDKKGKGSVSEDLNCAETRLTLTEAQAASRVLAVYNAQIVMSAALQNPS